MPTEKTLTSRLEQLAKNIELRFGRHPEADLVREAKTRIIELETKAQTEGEAPSKRASKKDTTNA